MKVDGRIVEDLKSEGHYFAAGAVAHALGQGRYYGCHYGMKSTRMDSMTEFFAGYDADAHASLREDADGR